MSQMKQLSQTNSLQNIKVARSQGGQIGGQLIKGFLNEAHLKTISGTIPSKFETIIVKEKNKKSFNSSGLRFYQNKMNSQVYLNQGLQEMKQSQLITQLNLGDNTPGPGHYDVRSSKLDQSQNFSKKGYNGFISGTQRNPFQPKYVNSGPGPGTYQNNNILNSTFHNTTSNINSELNLKKTATYAFSAISRDPVIKTNKVLPPGPGQYNPKMLEKELGGRNPFQSSQLRLKDMQNDIPGVGQYQLRQNLGKQPQSKKSNDENINNESDIFMNNKQKYLNKLNRKGLENARKLIDFVQDKAEDNNEAIFETDNKNQIQYMFKAQTFNRFGDIEMQALENNCQYQADQKRANNIIERSKQKLKCPGPTSFNLNEKYDKERREKIYVKSSQFMSETMRRPYGNYQQELGPNMKVVLKPKEKKSYHLNLVNRWV